MIKPVFSFGFSIFSALIAELLATLTGCGYWIASSQPPALSAADLDELRADASVVTITTRYTGAAPAIIDTEMTEIIEGAVARIDGVQALDRGWPGVPIRSTPPSNA